MSSQYFVICLSLSLPPSLSESGFTRKIGPIDKRKIETERETERQKEKMRTLILRN